MGKVVDEYVRRKDHGQFYGQAGTEVQCPGDDQSKQSGGGKGTRASEAADRHV